MTREHKKEEKDKQKKWIILFSILFVIKYLLALTR